MKEQGNDVGQVIGERLSRLKIGEAISHDRMVAFPVSGDGEGASSLDYRTLGEAIAENWAEVTERPEATVPELILWNRGKSMILVLDGEEIVGGRQNRIMNASFLVGAGSEVVLPVSCVEQGRWREVSPRFSTGEGSYFSLRQQKQIQVQASLRLSGHPVADQGAIWDGLAERHSAARSASATGAMDDLYRSRAETLTSYERAFPYVPGALGLIVAMNGHLAGAELFDQARTAEALWVKEIRSYALDAVEGPAGSPVGKEKVAKFLQRAQSARCEAFPSLALGEDVRLAGDGVVGSALIYQGTAVHLSLFRTRYDKATGTGRIVRSSMRRRMHRQDFDLH